MPTPRDIAIDRAGAALAKSDDALDADPQGALAARHRRNADHWMRLAELQTPLIVPAGGMLVQASYDGTGIESAVPYPELEGVPSARELRSIQSASFTPTADSEGDG